MNIINYDEVVAQLDTIGDFLRYATSQFNQAELFFGHGTDNAWDEAITLVMFALDLPDQLTDDVMQCKLLKEEKLTILSFVEQRIVEAIPVAYITHQAKFANLPFYVDERVLVPRSPIAELIEKRFSPYLDDTLAKRVTYVFSIYVQVAVVLLSLAQHIFPKQKLMP